MQHTIKICSFIGLLFFTMNCQPTKEIVTASEERKISATLKQLTTEIYAKASRLDTAQIFADYSPQTTLVYDGQLIPWEAQLAGAKALFGNLREAVLTIDQMEVDVLSPNTAVLYGKYHYKYTDKCDHTVTGNPAWTWIFVRENNVWKIRHAHLSYPAQGEHHH